MIRHLLQAGARLVLHGEFERARWALAGAELVARQLRRERDEATERAALAQERADTWQRDCEETARERDRSEQISAARWAHLLDIYGALGWEVGHPYCVAEVVDRLRKMVADQGRADKAEAKGQELAKQLAHYKRGMANWMQRALAAGRVPREAAPMHGRPCEGCFGCVRRYTSQPNICVGAGWIAPRADFEDGGEPLLRVDELPGRESGR